MRNRSAMRFRIAFLLHTFGHTGGSVVLYNFMDELTRRGHEVVVVTPTGSLRWEKDSAREWLERVGRERGRGYRLAKRIVKRVGWLGEQVRVLLGRPPAEEMRQFIWATVGLIRHWVPSDVTIATFCTTAIAAYLLSGRTKSIYHMQHYEPVFFESEEGRKLARVTYRLPITLVANSRWLQSVVRKTFGRESYVLNPGIDTDIFRPKVEVDKKFEEDQVTVILSYHSPVRFKAWDEAVRAMELVYEKMGKGALEWHVFGEVPDKRPPVPASFVGRRFGEALAELYSRAHVVFMNSWYESFPLPPLEAMACGAAVVTTRSGTEDYAVDGENSLIVPARQPEKLAEAILTLARDRKRAARLAKAGVETARRFTWQRAGDELEEIIRRVVDSEAADGGEEPEEVRAW
jgi:glycosyltransferase involved in cell wall biosynthesis